jgi:hypothetical protein
MAAVWGEAEIDVHVNGDHLVAETEALTKEAGARGGQQFTKSFDKNTSSGLKKSLADFSRSFKTWDKSLASNNQNMSSLSRRLRAFMKTVGNTEPMLRFRLGVMDASKKLEQWIGSSDRATSANGRQGSSWRRLSANTRQWTAIISAVIGAIGDLAGLASAAGSGLFILGSAFTAVGTAAIFSFVAFRKFTGDVKKLPAALKPARSAFDGFKKSFTEVMDAMTVEAFKGTESAWKHFGQVLKQLQPGFNAIGKVVKGLIIDLSKNLDAKTVKELNSFLKISAGIFDNLLRAIGRVGKALLTAFSSAPMQHAIQGLIGYIDHLADSFSKFLTGPGFDDWLRHGESVFGALGQLLGDTGKLLDGLVTDKTVENLTTFIQNIDGFLSGGAVGIFNFAQNLDIFGLLAQALNDVGKALEPLNKPMGDLAAALNAMVQSGINTLAPMIEALAKALAPFVQSIADLISAHPKVAADGLLAIAAAFGAWKLLNLGALAVQMLAFSTATDAAGNSIKRFDVKKLGKTAAGFGGLALAIGTVTDVVSGDKSPLQSLGKLSSATADFATSFALMGAAIGGPVGAGIGAALGIITGYIQNFQGALNDTGINLLSIITGGSWALFAANVATFFANLVPKDWQTSDNPLQRLVGNIAFVFTNFGDAMAKSVNAWQTVALPAWNTWWNVTLPTAVDQFGADVETNFMSWFDPTWAAFTGWIQTFEPNWNTWWGSLPQEVTRFGAEVEANATNAWTTVSGTFTAWGHTIAAGWNSFWGGLPSAVNKFGSDVDINVHRAWATVSSTFSSLAVTVTRNWNSFWGGLPAAVNKFGADIETNVRNLAGSFSRGFQSVWNTVKGWVDKIAGLIRQGLSNLPLVGGALNSVLPKAANGMIVTGPTHILGGEAGPEAIVPLRRSLSQVNKSVRGLSAIAQGKAAVPDMAGPNNSRTLNVEAGAIVIQGVRDPNAAALGVVNRLAERIAG